jgi:hypothetical protein
MLLRLLPLQLLAAQSFFPLSTLPSHSPLLSGQYRPICLPIPVLPVLWPILSPLSAPLLLQGNSWSRRWIFLKMRRPH